MSVKIITDNGPEFSNQLIVDLAYLIGLKHTFTSPFNFQSNGKVEEINNVIKRMV